MKPILLIDFGSTHTKLTAVDADAEEILGTAESYTTVDLDIGIGFNRALESLERDIGKLDFGERFACSSAAGGLKMVACGLVPTLTAEAAKRAALGAGAKVIKTYSYQLTEDDLLEIDRLQPDILLLTGGTDGGNAECILKNAEAIAVLKQNYPVILAGNRNAVKKCRELIEASGREVIVAENVMPRFHELNIDPCKKVIRELFLKRIIAAKGLSKAQALIDGILMPTPAAVLSALTMLAETKGELMAVDLGGATTDVYSITKGLPTRAGTILRGLPEPYAKRTVEGDIGMRCSAYGVLEACGLEKLADIAKQSEATMATWLDKIEKTKNVIPESAEEKASDFALASMAIELGLSRHAGVIEQVYTPMGVAYQQTGKDLTRTNLLILTGGALIHAASGEAERMAIRAMQTPNHPNSLMPREAKIAIDKRYILSAMGVLSKRHPELARKIMTKEFA